MTISTGIRSTVRGLITKLGSSANLYSYSDATKVTNEEGDVSVTWGTATEIKVISSDNQNFMRMLAKVGYENDEGGRSFLVRDDVTIEANDKIVIGTEAYLVDSIKLINPIEDTIILKSIGLAKDERYTV